ncbi:MAG: tetratricopeptide repeat protein [Victivallaceae bacterium]|nr:tetratricopeptide repeat protein [Victivallaceae bacterium]
MKYRLLIVMLAVGVCVRAAAPSGDAGTWELWNSGYEYYEKGRKAKFAGDNAKALQLLEESKKYYLEVKRTRPDWNQNVIDSRISMVESDLQVLRGLTGTPAPAVEVPPAAPGESVAAEPPKPAAPDTSTVRTRELAADRDRYREKVLELTRELETMRIRERANAANAGEIENLLRENRRISDELAALRRQQSALEERLARPDEEKKTLEARLVEEKAGAEALGRQLNDARTEIEKVKSDSDAAYRERNSLRMTERELTAKLANAERELGNLQNRRGFENAEREALNRKLSDAVREKERVTAELAVKDKAVEELRASHNALLKDPGLLKTEPAAVMQDNMALQEQLLAIRTENTALLDKLRKTEAENFKNSEEAKDLRGFIQDLDTRRKTAEEELRIGRDALTAAKTELENKISENKKAAARTAALEAAVLELTGQNDRLRRRAESGSANVQNMIDLNASRKALADELAVAKQQSDAVAADLEKRSAELAAAKAEIDRLTTENADKAAAIVRLEEFERDCKTLKPECERLTALNGELEAAAARDRNKLAELAADQRIAEETRLGLPELRRTLAETQTINQQLTQQLEAERLAALKVQQESAKQLDALNRQLNDTAAKLEAARDGRTLEAAPADYKPPEEPSTAMQVAGLLADAAGADTEELKFHYLRKAAALDPANPDAAAELGLLEYSSGSREKAERLLAAALAAYPEDAGLAAAYARIMLDSSRSGNALPVLEQALNARPNDYELRLLRAAALWRSGFLERAEDELAKLMASSPNRPDAYRETALMLAQNAPDRLDEAAGLYDQSRQLNGSADGYLETALAAKLSANRETVAFLYGSAAAAEDENELESAMWFYRELCGLEPRRELPGLHLALVLLKLDRPQEAIAALKALPAATPNEEETGLWNLLATKIAGMNAPAVRVDFESIRAEKTAAK